MTRITAGLWEHRHADRYGNPRQIFLEVPDDDALELDPELLGPARRSIRIRAGQDNDELLAAEPARYVLVTEQIFQAIADCTQHHVAGIVAVIVVVLFEMVDIDRQDADALTSARSSRKFAAAGFQHVTPVKETRQNVPNRLVPKLIAQFDVRDRQTDLFRADESQSPLLGDRLLIELAGRGQITAAKFEMEQPDRLTVRQDRDAAIFGVYRRIEMRAEKVDLVFAESVRPTTPQAPAIVGMHRRHYLATIPGFGALQNVARIGVDVEAASAGGRQPAEEFGHHLVELAQGVAGLEPFIEVRK